MGIKFKNKRGYYFTMDALIALIIILAVLFSVHIIPEPSKIETNTQDDLITVMSSIKMNEIDNSYVDTLRAEGKISENKTLLEQIAEFYAKEMPEAQLLAENIISSLNPHQNIGIWFQNELIASQNSTPYSESKEIHVARQIISGIERGNVTGFSSKAYLSQSNAVEYYYFGGYVGDGNISLRVDYDGVLKDIELEIAINKEFDLGINGHYSGHYSESPSETTPSEYDLDSYMGYLTSGQNTIEFSGDNLYIAGGYLKLTYEKDVVYNATQKHFIPGIDGLINIYDGLNFPENLTDMFLSLHFVSPYDIFVKIGNEIVYQGNVSSETTVTLNNASLAGMLDFNSLKGKTVPLRIGMKDVDYIQGAMQNLDAISVNPLPGSFNSITDIYGFTKEEVIQNANRQFVSTLLEVGTIRVGLIGIKADLTPDEYCHNISRDEESLNDTINEWDLTSGVCHCCGINKAVEYFSDQSEPTTIKKMVIMADDKPTTGCGGDATQDAIDAACDAYDNYNISTIAISLGTNAQGQAMLQAMAACSNGSYYEGTPEDMALIYQEVAEAIINASYSRQTIEYVGDYGVELWPDSYIEFGFEEEEIPYGLVVASESDNYNSSSMTSFNVPLNSTPLEAFSTSYSGDKWSLYLNLLRNSSWENIYNLTDYGQEFTEIGDPFVIKIPADQISEGDNLVELITGFSQENTSIASDSDKIIYKVLKRALVYSPITAVANGCEWTIEFNDGSFLNVSVPLNYTGSSCEYSSSQISYNPNDAIDYSVYMLLRELDLNLDGRVDNKFSENSLNISSSRVDGIPYTYRSEIQIRTWR